MTRGLLNDSLWFLIICSSLLCSNLSLLANKQFFIFGSHMFKFCFHRLMRLQAPLISLVIIKLNLLHVIFRLMMLPNNFLGGGHFFNVTRRHLLFCVVWCESDLWSGVLRLVLGHSRFSAMTNILSAIDLLSLSRVQFGVSSAIFTLHVTIRFSPWRSFSIVAFRWQTCVFQAFISVVAKLCFWHVTLRALRLDQ